MGTGLMPEHGQERGEPMSGTLRSILRRSPLFMEVLTRCAALDPPGWYLAAGCVAQTVWNHLTHRPPDFGIRDYDLIYFDASDTSWEAENAVIESAAALAADLPIDLEVRNEARVHLWYEQRFGIPCPPYSSSEDAIGTFPATATSIGVKLLPAGQWRCHAPFGLDDLLSLTVRPNQALAPRHVYERKSQRWARCWPELRILPYPPGEPLE